MNAPDTTSDWIARVLLRLWEGMSRHGKSPLSGTVIAGQLALLATYPVRMLRYLARDGAMGVEPARVSIYAAEERPARAYSPTAR